ncbi:MAG: hypothetical protein HFI78_04200 [Lachnospiraceae bacterium]|jgi:hypothetical protein|nr:hypothetical protein [Lachnospiraceae bacterium]
MDEEKEWKKFENSGRITDYLCYKNVSGLNNVGWKGHQTEGNQNEGMGGSYRDGAAGRADGRI